MKHRIGQIENTEQDEKLKLNHISNDIKCQPPKDSN